MGQKVTIIQLMSRASRQKRNSEGCSFFYSEAGILHGKSRAVDLQGRMRGRNVGFFRAVFVAGNSNYNYIYCFVIFTLANAARSVI